ncbi:hypothetical protein SEUCBS139899_001640 [Sporothrix eucalyptigena]|uniref:RNA binding protein Nrd1 n=1 Tax=Sporothrix eucalyptigena TaxID=1812306 RepID=A0ABP0CN04_9PEZI
MSSPVAELEAGLQAMQNLKPPGVSGSRITSLTALCVANVQSESVLIQKLYTHFKKTPGTHKLGVLYVVDSVTRKWLDQAKQQGQAINGSAPDGTYAAGVNRVTELIPVLMNDILSSAPADQKDKIRKLVDIWEKGQTFPPKLLESFKEKLNASQQNASTTPPGSPPPSVLNPNAGRPGAAPAAGPPALPPNIMETLANLAKQSTAAAAAPAPPATATPPTLSGPFGQQPPANLYGAAQPPPFQMPPAQPPQQAPYSMPYGAPAAPAAASAPPALAGLASLIGAASQQQPHQPPPPQAAAPQNVQQNLMFIQALLAQGLSIDQVSAILAQVGNGGAPGAPTGPASLVPSAIAAAAAASNGQAAPQWPPHNGGTQDWNNHGGRSPGGRGRSRSRSPPRWDAHGSPRGGRRQSPGGRDRGRSGRDYRQRSPAGGNGHHSPRHIEPPSPGSKWVEHDPTLPQNTIRVLSRTLFVGGVNIPESELRTIFTRFGDVQTCIVNKEKRHAFVKMYTRADAEAAKNGMEHARGTEDTGLRTRWGVGFGPRDCSDYSKGVSVIPIAKLTEADRKWLLTAPWGGSGGRPIATGLVVEEPDIEIGAGVSSKAISRRMQTDRGGLNGPRSTRREEELANANTVPINPRGGRRGGRGGGGHDRGAGNHDRRGGGNGSGAGDELNYGGGGSDSNGKNGAAPPNGFPFGLTVGANGMPVFPPGFTFPAPE